MPSDDGMEGDVRSLGERLEGRVLGPGDDGWDEARQAFNLLVDQRPTAIALPASTDDVIAVVRFATDRGLRVAPQGAAHNAGAIDSLDETVLLRTSMLTGVDVDAQARRARVAAGTRWGQVIEPASERGLAGLAGSSPTVGVVGYTLGGGIGWLTRRHGLACNSVTAAEVVTADGRLVRADEEQDPDLFWALRGGGGSFGVVTALEFDLYPLEALYAGALFWPWERSSDVLHRWREWVSTVPDEVTTIGRILQIPPIPEIPEPFRGRSLAGVELAYLGGEDDGAKLVQPLRELGPEIDTLGTIPPAALPMLHMDPLDPSPAVTGHQLLGELPAQAIDELVAVAGPGSGSPILSLELRLLGGALRRPQPGHGALPSLEAAYAMFAVALAMDAGMAAAIEAHLPRLTGALDPWDAGRYLSFVDRPTDTVTAYPPETHRRLREVKASYDPRDVFRANHPIPPAA